MTADEPDDEKEPPAGGRQPTNEERPA